MNPEFPDPNKNSDMEEAIKIPKTYLKMAGYWSTEEPIFLPQLRRITIFTMSLLMTAFGIIDTIKFIDDFEQISEHLTLTSTMASFLMKLFVFRRHIKPFTALLNHMKLPILHSYPNKFDHHLQSAIQTCTKLGRFYQFLCLMVIILYALLPQFSSFDLPFYFPMKVTGISRMIVYAFHSITLGLSACLNCSLDILASFLMCTVAAQIRICNDMIESCNHGQDERSAFLRLKECIFHHNTIIQFAKHVEEVFTYIFLIQYLSSIIAICNSGFQMVHVEPTSIEFALMIVYFMTMSCQLSMYCWFGNEVLVFSTETRKACYNADWVNCSKNIKQILLVIVERSKKPIFLTAGKFSILSLATLTSVINASYSYFALLQRLYSKTEKKQ